jgi:Phage P22-like portal protein
METFPEGITVEAISEMDTRRLERLDEAGINELDVLGQAKENLNIWNGYFNENIVRGKDDMNFVIRDQWTAIERSEFTRLMKPAMTANKLYDATKKIAGEQRKNKPDLLVRSLTGKATQEQISLRADLVRTISYQSQNDLVYQTAFRSALMLGFGAFQIEIDYETPRSFNQIIKFTGINDATRCVFDPTAIKPHKGDGNYCARNYVMSKQQFFATYPYVSNPVSYTDPYYLLDFQWETKDTIVLCDYFVKEWYPILIYKLSNGEAVSEEEWESMQPDLELKRTLAKDSEIGRVIMKEIPTIVAERQSQDYRIMHYRLVQNQVIDFTEWPSKHLPLIFVDGDSYFIEGRQYTKSFIHEARDMQKLHNYSMSEIATELKNRRREQWLGTPDNIAGYEQEWRNPELQMGMLRAKPDPKTGQMPQKTPASEVPQGLFVTAQTTNQAMQEIMGFSENEQLQGRDISGKARRERKLEGSMSAYVYFDNLNQAIEQAGRCVLDLLPVVYGGDERHIVISKQDGKTKSLTLNKQLPNGEIENELTAGDYDIEIDTGPSFAVQKDVALEFFQETIATNPQVFPLVADLWASNLDIEQMPLVKERLTNLVPPEIIAKEKGEQPPPPKPNPQEQMMQAEIQMKQAELKNKQADLQIKAQELQIKKEQNELDKAEIMLKAQKIQSDAQLNVYDHQANIEKTRITHGLNKQKTDLDFKHKIAALLTDIYKHENPQKKEKGEEKEK